MTLSTIVATYGLTAVVVLAIVVLTWSLHVVRNSITSSVAATMGSISDAMQNLHERLTDLERRQLRCDTLVAQALGRGLDIFGPNAAEDELRSLTEEGFLAIPRKESDNE